MYGLITEKTMNQSLTRLIETSYEMIRLAKNMLHSCQLKKSKVFSESRYLVSFFLRRSWELFESFIMLVKETRIIDSAILLRSALEMGFSLGYVFAKGINEKENEIRALVYLLDGERQQLKLIDSNLEGFKEYDCNLEVRRNELKEQINRMEEILKEIYKRKDWHLPSIQERVRLSNSEVLKKAYNQSYRDLSNIEHHSILFGNHYVDEKECEPIVNIDHLQHYPQLKPSVCLFLLRIVFIEILSVFNDVFNLKWKTQIDRIKKYQDEEYILVKD